MGADDERTEEKPATPNIYAIKLGTVSIPTPVFPDDNDEKSEGNLLRGLTANTTEAITYYGVRNQKTSSTLIKKIGDTSIEGADAPLTIMRGPFNVFPTLAGQAKTAWNFPFISSSQPSVGIPAVMSVVLYPIVQATLAAEDITEEEFNQDPEKFFSQYFANIQDKKAQPLDYAKNIRAGLRKLSSYLNELHLNSPALQKNYAEITLTYKRIEESASTNTEVYLCLVEKPDAAPTLVIPKKTAWERITHFLTLADDVLITQALLYWLAWGCGIILFNSYALIIPGSFGVSALFGVVPAFTFTAYFIGIKLFNWIETKLRRPVEQTETGFWNQWIKPLFDGRAFNRYPTGFYYITKFFVAVSMLVVAPVYGMVYFFKKPQPGQSVDLGTTHQIEASAANLEKFIKIGREAALLSQYDAPPLLDQQHQTNPLDTTATHLNNEASADSPPPSLNGWFHSTNNTIKGKLFSSIDYVRFFWLAFVRRLAGFEYQLWFISAALMYFTAIELVFPVSSVVTYVVAGSLLAISFLYAIYQTRNYRKEKNAQIEERHCNNIYLLNEMPDSAEGLKEYAGKYIIIKNKNENEQLTSPYNYKAYYIAEDLSIPQPTLELENFDFSGVSEKLNLCPADAVQPLQQLLTAQEQQRILPALWNQIVRHHTPGKNNKTFQEQLLLQDIAYYKQKIAGTRAAIEMDKLSCPPESTQQIDEALKSIPDATDLNNLKQVKDNTKKQSNLGQFFKHPYWVAFSLVALFFINSVFSSRLLLLNGTGVSTNFLLFPLQQLLISISIPFSPGVVLACLLSYIVIHALLGFYKDKQEKKAAEKKLQYELAPLQKICLQKQLARLNQLKQQQLVQNQRLVQMSAAELEEKKSSPPPILSSNNISASSSSVSASSSSSSLSSSSLSSSSLSSSSLSSSSLSSSSLSSSSLSSLSAPTNLLAEDNSLYPEPELWNITIKHRVQDQIAYWLGGLALAGLVSLFTLLCVPALAPLLSINLILWMGIPLYLMGLMALTSHRFASRQILTPNEKRLTEFLLISLSISFALLIALYANPLLTSSIALYIFFSVTTFLAAVAFTAIFNKNHEDLLLSPDDWASKKQAVHNILKEKHTLLLQGRDREFMLHTLTLLMKTINPKESGRGVSLQPEEKQLLTDFKWLEHLRQKIQTKEPIYHNDYSEVEPIIQRVHSLSSSNLSGVKKIFKRPNQQALAQVVAFIFLLVLASLMIYLPAVWAAPVWVKWLMASSVIGCAAFKIAAEKIAKHENSSLAEKGKFVANLLSIKTLTALALSSAFIVLLIGGILLPIFAAIVPFGAYATLPIPGLILLVMVSLALMQAIIVSLNYLLDSSDHAKLPKLLENLPNGFSRLLEGMNSINIIVLGCLGMGLPVASFLLLTGIISVAPTALIVVAALGTLPLCFFIFKVLLPKALLAQKKYQETDPEKINAYKTTISKFCNVIIYVLSGLMAVAISVLAGTGMAPPALFICLAWPVGIVVNRLGRYVYSHLFAPNPLAEDNGRTSEEQQPTSTDSINPAEVISMQEEKITHSESSPHPRSSSKNFLNTPTDNEVQQPPSLSQLPTFHASLPGAKNTPHTPAPDDNDLSFESWLKQMLNSSPHSRIPKSHLFRSAPSISPTPQVSDGSYQSSSSITKSKKFSNDSKPSPMTEIYGADEENNGEPSSSISALSAPLVSPSH